MPIYDWACQKCDKDFETVQSILEYNGKENCPECGNPAERIYTKATFYSTGASVQDAYKCPALGEVIKSKYDRSEWAKRKDVVEVGNDFSTPDKMYETFDRDKETKRKKSWDEV